MTFFLIVMCVGLVGLAAMALPGLFHHGLSGHGHSTHVHGVGPHVAHHGHAAVPASHPGAHAGHAAHASHAAHTGKGLAHLIPEPRLVFSLLALYGAFGNALVAWAFAPFWLVALLALLPALLVERYLLKPLWRLAFRFQGQPSSPLPALLLEEAHAVTPFRNGRGVVRVIRDGRSVQLSARLVEAQAALPVRVGDRLRIEDVEAEKERVTVSLL